MSADTKSAADQEQMDPVKAILSIVQGLNDRLKRIEQACGLRPPADATQEEHDAHE